MLGITACHAPLPFLPAPLPGVFTTYMNKLETLGWPSAKKSVNTGFPKLIWLWNPVFAYYLSKSSRIWGPLNLTGETLFLAEVLPLSINACVTLFGWSCPRLVRNTLSIKQPVCLVYNELFSVLQELSYLDYDSRWIHVVLNSIL